jgi:putative transposase
LVQLEKVSPGGHSRNCGPLASRRVSTVLEFDFEGGEQVGRKQLSTEVRELIFRMVAENPTWGAPRIHGELRMLGFDVSERTISRWMKRAPRDPESACRWFAFLCNHREAIAAMDFFAVPTATFSLLYCFFIISQ